MGLKVLKWAYNLGVEHERKRIAAVLQNEADMVGQRHNELYRELNKHPDEPSREEISANLAVTEKVRLLINNLFYAQDQYIPGASIMFPKEEKK